MNSIVTDTRSEMGKRTAVVSTHGVLSLHK